MITAQYIADFISGEIVGDTTVEIKGVSGINEAQKGDLTFLDNRKYLPYLNETKASLVILGRDMQIPKGKTVIRVENPSLSFARALELFLKPERVFPPGIHDTAILHPQSIIGHNVSIGPYSVIEEGVVIADNVSIGSNVYIGVETHIGKDSKLYPSVSIFARSRIGERVIIHAGSVVGSDGFGYVKVEGKQTKIPQLGNVIIEDDVEIGANVTVDRARFGSTVIEKGVKIDNLVQIAHNVKIGAHSIIIAQAGIAGSCVLGTETIIAGQAGLVGHLHIGDGAVIMGKSGVSKDVPAGEKWFGSPARNVMETNRQLAAVARIPQLIKRIEQLEKKLDKQP